MNSLKARVCLGAVVVGSMVFAVSFGGARNIAVADETGNCYRNVVSSCCESDEWYSIDCSGTTCYALIVDDGDYNHPEARFATGYLPQPVWNGETVECLMYPPFCNYSLEPPCDVSDILHEFECCDVDDLIGQYDCPNMG